MNTEPSESMAMTHAAEVASGDRFEFGRNWKRFLNVLDDRRIEMATQALSRMLNMPSLAGKTFLDIGSGSGLSSLAAHRLGAEVLSFDYDPHSVACTRELQRRYGGSGAAWKVQEGSVLDQPYLRSLGQFDIVYSWGVLHHTGQMWQAIDNATLPVADGGTLFIAIYNDQGAQSKRWHAIKHTYNRLPGGLKEVFGFAVMGGRDLRFLAGDLLRLRPQHYVRRWTTYAASNQRGMSRLHDWIDWVGGYPFEVAKPEEVFRFLQQRGFVLDNMVTCAGGVGCNEYILRRTAQANPVAT